jgi:RNA polymerase sigma-70 factor (ECF subfamily)
LDHTDTALLISRSREGDAAAVETLVHTYREPIFRLAISLLDDPAEADEATQDAFVAAIDRLHTFRGEASFTTWLYAIALNVCRGRLRKRRGRERLLGVLQSLFRAERDSVEPPEQAVIQRETGAALRQAIDTLDERQREVIILRYYHELRLEDIAQIAGVSDRTIRNRLHSAHERLRFLLKGKIDLK